jgi:hypothetical protein
MVAVWRRWPHAADPTATGPEAQPAEVASFQTPTARVRSAEFRARGRLMGSGVAEAAGKTVASTRAKRAGMRWTPTGLDAIVPLRTAVLNETYDAFWQDRPRLCA